MTEVTLEDLVDAFREAVETVENHLTEDAEGIDAEYNYLRIVLTTLETTLEELDNFGINQQTKLAIAASRIPGLLYLYQLY